MIKTSVNVPFTDDYDAIADFLYRYVHRDGFLARIEWILTAQHSQYKLIVLNAAVALQYHLIGRTNYRTLQLIGDLTLPATLWLFWLLLTRQQRPRQQAVWLILIPWYLFLSLSCFETLNWATSGLQSLAIIPLAIACVLFFTSTIRRATALGTLFLVLSIAANANGFVLALAVLILLAYQRKFGALLAVTLAVCLMGAVYRAHYTPLPMGSSLPPLGGAVTFAFAFLGGLFPTLHGSAAFGVLLVAGFLILLTRGWARLSPETFCIALFCLLTAIALPRARFHEGIESAMSSRYRLYPLMLSSAEYLAVLRIFVPQRLRLRSPWTAAIGLATSAAMIFGITSQIKAYRELHARQRALITHLILWERHPERVVLIPDEDSEFRKARWALFRVHTQEILGESIASGLYIPPYSAHDALPLKTHSPATTDIEDETPPPQH